MFTVTGAFAKWSADDAHVSHPKCKRLGRRKWPVQDGQRRQGLERLPRSCDLLLRLQCHVEVILLSAGAKAAKFIVLVRHVKKFDVVVVQLQLTAAEFGRYAMALRVQAKAKIAEYRPVVGWDRFVLCVDDKQIDGHASPEVIRFQNAMFIVADLTTIYAAYPIRKVCMGVVLPIHFNQTLLHDANEASDF